MNNFCTKDCAGGDIKEVVGCRDCYCPFHPFRFDDLDWQRKKRSMKRSKDERLAQRQP